MIYSKNISVLSIMIVGLLTYNCARQTADEIVVYENDFERDLIDAYQRVDSVNTSFDQISENYFHFNGSRNLGRFDTGGIILDLEGLPEHQWLRISFDFYVHDNWEGNGLRGNGEDVVIFNVDQLNLHFSSIVNTGCIGQDCDAVQSFPNRIGEGQNPENAGVINDELPGVCHFEGQVGGTKLIKFANRVPHGSTTVRVNIAAGIKDAGTDLCLKSWSIDNLKISTISLPENQ